MNRADGNGKSALLLCGGTVIDGTGADRFVADVRIDGDRITAIGAGWFADVCVFDPATVRDVATFEQPQAISRGIEYVLVNGAFTLRHRREGPDRAGRFLPSGRG